MVMRVSFNTASEVSAYPRVRGNVLYLVLTAVCSVNRPLWSQENNSTFSLSPHSDMQHLGSMQSALFLQKGKHSSLQSFESLCRMLGI